MIHLLRNAGLSACNMANCDTKTNVTEAEALAFFICTQKVFQAANLGDSNANLCSKRCLPPCSEYTYAQSVSVSGSWPHPIYQRHFYETYIQGTPIERDFKIVSQ